MIVFAALEETGRGQLVLATGLGKTVVMAEVASRLFDAGTLENRRILVLADKRELVRQLQIGFWAQLPKNVATHLLAPEEEPAYWEESHLRRFRRFTAGLRSCRILTLSSWTRRITSVHEHIRRCCINSLLSGSLA